jgi:uncharacterized damage-inducible protein DinB
LKPLGAAIIHSPRRRNHMATKHTAARPTVGSREIARLLDQFERAFAGDAWLGMPVNELLGDVDAGLAALHPIAGGHSIWELVTHITYWLDAAARRLGGETVDPLHDEDWPATPQPTAGAWKQALTALQTSQDRLLVAVRRLEEKDLDGPVPGHAYTKYVLLHGVLQHTLYHAGQIGLLKRAART